MCAGVQATIPTQQSCQGPDEKGLLCLGPSDRHQLWMEETILCESGLVDGKIDGKGFSYSWLLFSWFTPRNVGSLSSVKAPTGAGKKQFRNVSQSMYVLVVVYKNDHANDSGMMWHVQSIIESIWSEQMKCLFGMRISLYASKLCCGRVCGMFVSVQGVCFLRSHSGKTSPNIKHAPKKPWVGHVAAICIIYIHLLWVHVMFGSVIMAISEDHQEANCWIYTMYYKIRL